MRHRTLAPLVGLAAVAALVAVGLVACGGSASGSAAGAAPALQGTTMQGEPFDLADPQGKPTVVNFFASWCPPCNSEAPDLVAFAAAHPEVRFVGVATNDAQADTERFVAEYRVPYTVVMDPDGEIATTWGADAIPRTVFIDRQGKVKDVIVGAAGQAQFEENLKSIL